jgi:hypothetical protein
MEKVEISSNQPESIDASSNLLFDHTQKQTLSRFNQLKQLVLVLLVVQNVATILSIKQASSIRAQDGRQALTTSIVVMVEILKVSLCISEILVRCALACVPDPCRLSSNTENS